MVKTRWEAATPCSAGQLSILGAAGGEGRPRIGRAYCALIGRELHSEAKPALLCYKEPAQGT